MPNRTAHFLAVATAILIFPLIFVGAGVTTKDAGMVFPDWPTSDGAVLNPPGWLQNDAKLWEHSHRLIGWTVGLVAIGSAVACWRRRGAARALALATLSMIIVQGLLGGLRVTEISRGLAMLHGIWGQLCFCAALATTMLTSPSWASASRPLSVRGARMYQWGCIAAVGGVFVQLCIGAAYRHFASREALIGHVLWAVVIFLVLSWLAMWTLEQYPRLAPLSTLGKVLAALIAAQMILGGVAFLVEVMAMRSPAIVAWLGPTAHVAAGALMLGCVVLMTLCAFRHLCPAAERNPAAAAMTQ